MEAGSTGSGITVWVRALAVSLGPQVTLGKPVTLPTPRFLHLDLCLCGFPLDVAATPLGIRSREPPTPALGHCALAWVPRWAQPHPGAPQASSAHTPASPGNGVATPQANWLTPGYTFPAARSALRFGDLCRRASPSRLPLGDPDSRFRGKSFNDWPRGGHLYWLSGLN